MYHTGIYQKCTIAGTDLRDREYGGNRDCHCSGYIPYTRGTCTCSCAFLEIFLTYYIPYHKYKDMSLGSHLNHSIRGFK